MPADDTTDGVYAYLRFPTNAQETQGVARIIAARVAAGVRPADIAVLVRSNMDRWAEPLRKALESLEIPLASTDWVKEVLREDEVRRGIALGHLATNRTDSLAWWSLLVLTPRVGPTFIDYVYDNVDMGETFGQALLRLHEGRFPGAPHGAQNAASTIQQIVTIVTALEMENASLDERGWGGWLVDQMNVGQLTLNAVTLFERVGALVDPSEGLPGFLSNLEPVGKDIAANSVNAVRMLTMAQSKGLTVDTAIVMGVEEGIVPLPPPKGDPDEERRLLYVAMTRATNMCVLTWAARRIGPSARFGAPNVAQTRNRSPLLANLPGGVGRPQAGLAWVSRLEEGASM